MVHQDIIQTIPVVMDFRFELHAEIASCFSFFLW